MRKFNLVLITAACLAVALPGICQSMSNTDNVITLTNTCINAGLSNGTYNLELNYYDLGLTTSRTVTFNNVAVVVSGGVMTITAPSGSFPSVATNGSWSLPDAWPGHITLTQGSTSALMQFYQNPDGSLGFNCIALPTIFGNFSLFPAGTNALLLFWTTELEQNSTFIEIWRSSTDSAHSFYKIGQVTAAGNSNSPISYQFTDTSIDTQNYYYLKALNSEGTPPDYSDTVSWRCDDCHFTPPTPVNCTDSIIGPDHICALETPTSYHLSAAVPNYSTILWNVDNPASVRVSYTSDPAQVNLLRTDIPGLVTLRAIMSGCTDTITRNLYIGTPDLVLTPTYFCPTSIKFTATGAAAPSKYNWYLRDDTLGIAYKGFTYTYNFFSVTNTVGHSYTAGGQYINPCGTSNQVLLHGITCGAAPSLAAVTLSPNPSNGIIGVSLQEGAVRHPIYQIRVLDVQGVIRKIIKYPGVGNVSVDLSGLTGGIYTVQVFDNKTWTSNKVILVK